MARVDGGSQAPGASSGANLRAAHLAEEAGDTFADGGSASASTGGLSGTMPRYLWLLVGDCTEANYYVLDGMAGSDTSVGYGGHRILTRVRVRLTSKEFSCGEGASVEYRIDYWRRSQVMERYERLGTTYVSIDSPLFDPETLDCNGEVTYSTYRNSMVSPVAPSEGSLEYFGVCMHCVAWSSLLTGKTLNTVFEQLDPHLDALEGGADSGWVGGAGASLTTAASRANWALPFAGCMGDLGGLCDHCLDDPDDFDDPDADDGTDAGP